MADKRISQLVERTDIANNDVLPIVASGATTTNKVTISTIQDWMQDNLDVGVTSVGITLGTTGTDINVTGSPVTSSGNITINLPTASATNRGALSSADWSTFNSKQGAITLTTTGTSGVSTLVGNTLNIPNYSTDLSGYVTLGTAQTITAQKTFTTSGSSDTMIISHGSGSGFALDVIKAGSGEAIRVQKTSGSGNAMTISGGNFEAPTIVKTGGTSSQFLKADGSVDSSTYLTTGTAASTYVPYTGAGANVDLGVYNITSSAVNVNGSGSNAGVINLESNTIFPLVNGYGTIGSGTTNQFNFYQTTGAGVFRGAILSLNSIADSVTRTYTLPNADGTLALTSDLSAYLPLTGGTISGTLNVGSGSIRIAAEGASNITILRNFTGTAQGQSGFNHIGFNNSNNLYFTKNLNNGCIFSFNNSTYRTYTFPDADATIASTSNLSAYLPLAGGTLTGALNGTSATFNSTGVHLTLNSTSSGGGYFNLQRSGVNYAIIGNAGSITGANTDSLALQATNNIYFQTSGNNTRLTLSSTGAATFSSSVTTGSTLQANGNVYVLPTISGGGSGGLFLGVYPETPYSKQAILVERYTSTSGNYGRGNLHFCNRDTADANQPTLTDSRMTITSTGNVGIGTDSPNANLDIQRVAGDSNDILRLGSNQNYYFGFSRNTSNGALQIQGNQTGNNNISLAPTSGNVGIGTASPSHKLVVEGSESIVSIVDNRSFATGVGGALYFFGNYRSVGDPTVAGYIKGSKVNSTDGDYGFNLIFGTQTYTGGVSEKMRITSVGNTQPGADNAYSLGVSGTRWSAVWAANGTIQTSDEREKKDILDSDLGLDLITKLRPVSFKWKVGQNIVTSEVLKDEEGNPILDEEGKEKTESVITPREGKRTHYGLIAQEVEEVLDGKDFGGFIHDEETDIKGLRYDQFVPLLIKAIQELKTEIDSLKNQIK
jgi:hypothetical protein